MSLSKSQEDKNWNKAVFWVFDVPSLLDKPFETRIEFLKELKKEGKLSEFVNIVEFTECQG